MKALVAMFTCAAFFAHINFDLKHLMLTSEYSTWLPLACGRATAAILGTSLGLSRACSARLCDCCDDAKVIFCLVDPMGDKQTDLLTTT